MSGTQKSKLGSAAPRGFRPKLRGEGLQLGDLGAWSVNHSFAGFGWHKTPQNLPTGQSEPTENWTATWNEA